MPETGDAASSTSTLPTRGAVSLSTIAPPPAVRRDLHLSLTELPDEELISLSKEGDETAFGEFIRRHAATVHRWMARAVGEQDADDMAQDVFLKAYRGLSRSPRDRGAETPLRRSRRSGGISRGRGTGS